MNIPVANISRVSVPLRPPALKAGDTIAIVAPAGPLVVRDIFDRSVAAIERLGFKVRYSERIFQSERYMAGNDVARAEELLQAIADPTVQAIVAMRGGYGCARLIPLLRERIVNMPPKIFMGFSDLTTLHLFLNKQGWVTIHGPMMTSAALAEMNAEGQQHLFSLLGDSLYRPTIRPRQSECWSPGQAEGVVTGGCLSLITTSIGTVYEIETTGRILFLEDCGEPPYRIDRMLTHLRLAGKLDGLAGLVLGPFPDCDPMTGDYTVADVLRDAFAAMRIPILANFPAGHIHDNQAFPLGVRARLDADRRTLGFLDAAVTE